LALLNPFIDRPVGHKYDKPKNNSSQGFFQVFSEEMDLSVNKLLLLGFYLANSFSIWDVLKDST
jgi:hypothetical protein